MLKIKPHLLTAYALFAAITGAYLIMAIKFPIAYIWATYEDSFGEWTQFYLFGAAFVFSLGLWFRKWPHRWFFIALSLACFYVLMEEISWGQRLFRFSTPELIKQYNLQGEANIHNILVGPVRTPLKSAMEALVAIGIVVYGFAFPLALRGRLRFARWLHTHGIAFPPLYLSPFFIAGGLLEAGLFSFNEAEVAEILIGAGLMSMSLHYLFFDPPKSGLESEISWSNHESDRLALRFCWTWMAVFGLAIVTTLSVYATPAGKARLDKRIENGIEKFAGRYARYEQWDMAITLYRHVRTQKPNSTSTLRKLARAYGQSGDPEREKRYLRKAIAIDLGKHRDNPRSTSVLRSLVRSYRQMDNDKKAEFLLKKALDIGLKRVDRRPNSSRAAYSLGKTYELMDKDQSALAQYKRATELKPTSKSYRKAYLRIKGKL